MKKLSDWVRPGVDEVRARPRTESRELIRLDLPTLERPKKAISGFASRGQSASLNALLRNSALNEPLIFADKRRSDLRLSAKISGFFISTSRPRLRPWRQRVVGRARSFSACGP